MLEKIFITLLYHVGQKLNCITEINAHQVISTFNEQDTVLV